MTTNSLDKQAGIDMLEKAISKIEESITLSEGNLTVKMKPKAVSQMDEMELEKLMAQAERENAEISGDEEEEGEEGEATGEAGEEDAEEEDEE
jgi:translation initiation factor 2 subunit 1